MLAGLAGLQQKGRFKSARGRRLAGPRWTAPADHRKAATKHDTPCNTLRAAETLAQHAAEGTWVPSPERALLRNRVPDTPSGLTSLRRFADGLSSSGSTTPSHRNPPPTSFLCLLHRSTFGISLAQHYCSLSPYGHAWNLSRELAPPSISHFPRRLQLGVPWP